MRRSVLRKLVFLIAVLCMTAVNGLAVRAASVPPGPAVGPFDAYAIITDREGYGRIAEGGHDILGVDDLGAGKLKVSLTLTYDLRDELMAQGFEPRPWTNAAGQSFAELQAIEQEEGDGVYRPFDGDEGIAKELWDLGAAHPGHVEVRVLGTSLQDRDIIALRVTKDVATTEIGTKPMVLFNSLQHAREWIAVETNRRLAHHFIENYGSDETVTALVDEKEIWFVVVANPDGYQLTHRERLDGDPNWRLWRKNVRDNNEDGEIDSGDGVDPNRNFPGHWGYDQDGSSDNPQSGTYRGTGAASEPMVAALVNLLTTYHFDIMLNYHSAAELILWPDGWQDQTRTADDPIYTALAGDRWNPAVEGFLPILSAGLYITNGETCDWAHSGADTLCYTPELSTPPAGSGGSGFEFPDDEALIEAEFQINLPFALDIARSAGNLTEPSSHLGNEIEPIYVDDFWYSYGDDQPVEANVQRKLGDVTMVYTINGGEEQRAPTVEWDGGERFGEFGDVHYRRVRGVVSGAQPGDEVSVWFEAGGEASFEFTYLMQSNTGARVLVLSAEDYTGINPEYDNIEGPTYLGDYLDALDELDLSYDVYDFDALGRHAPSHLGVLSHYEAVIWYSADDIAIQREGMLPGNVSREAFDLMIAVRAYLNEGGKLLYTGKYPGWVQYQGWEYDPIADDDCDPQVGDDGCEEFQNDFMQYYLGADGRDSVSPVSGARVVGSVAPFEGLDILLEEVEAGSVMDAGAAFDVISERMPPDTYPQFTSWGAAGFQGAGIGPRTGESFLYSGQTNYSWQTVQQTFAFTDATTAELNFWVNRRARQPFDALIVEAHTPGQEDWTTLPDINGHTTPEDAASCWSSAWFGIFPKLVHYQTPIDDQNCQPTGTTGSWNAATGTGNGWENWAIDLTPYAGRSVEISITYLSSRSAFEGIYIDDVEVTADGAVVAETSFEDDEGGWTLGILETTNDTGNNVPFSRYSKDMIPPIDGAIVVTEDSILLGFGFESIADSEDQIELMRRAMDHLLGAAPPDPTPTSPPTVEGIFIYLPRLFQGE